MGQDPQRWGAGPFSQQPDLVAAGDGPTPWASEAVVPGLGKAAKASSSLSSCALSLGRTPCLSLHAENQTRAPGGALGTVPRSGTCKGWHPGSAGAFFREKACLQLPGLWPGRACAGGCSVHPEQGRLPAGRRGQASEHRAEGPGTEARPEGSRPAPWWQGGPRRTAPPLGAPASALNHLHFNYLEPCLVAPAPPPIKGRHFPSPLLSLPCQVCPLPVMSFTSCISFPA